MKFHEGRDGASGGQAAKGETPSIETVLKYAEGPIGYWIGRFGRNHPDEHQEEMRQEAIERLLNCYKGIDQYCIEWRGRNPDSDKDAPWRAFVQRHCKGAIQDYIREGRGFKERAERLQEDDEGDDPGGIRHRVDIQNENGETLDAEEVAGIFGRWETDFDKLRPDWDLVARLSSKFEDVHLIAMVWQGYTQEELSAQFGVTRERLSQRIKALLNSLKRPGARRSRKLVQIANAFNLTEHTGLPKVDNGLGRDWDPVDLRRPDSVAHARKENCPPLLEVPECNRQKKGRQKKNHEAHSIRNKETLPNGCPGVSAGGAHKETQEAFPGF